ncbi:hypothetical protein JHJ32_21130 [Parapedobacter sp. ISTM3]|uniref:hypothetical protein n=1 Tax=Parapedobacter sp. ISTM3 TaxID=2800130 RepID=UPI001905662B|nr:hypothetical protein [Parapedobacter sp. ISTM3]MBK1442516.1 hypothetical protein [Parapedobacter sp. ISTM3]
MKNSLLSNLLGVICIFFGMYGHAQQSGSITVGGDFNTYYPVSWYDGAWSSNQQTELHIGRSSAHTNSQWRGALIASFRFHVSNWGHQAQFINADIASFQGTANVAPRNFVGGWADASGGNSGMRIVIWLRGGGTTYYYQANGSVDPMVYDDILNPLPYTTSNGRVYGIKTTEDDYVNHFGTTTSQSIRSESVRDNVFMGNVGIGTRTPQAKLAVDGNILAKEVKVKTDITVPDYVFEEGYELPTLSEIAAYVKQHKHLPEIPSARDIENDGLNLAEMNLLLLKKVEELTLHLIEKDLMLDGNAKAVRKQQIVIDEQNANITDLRNRTENLEKLLDKVLKDTTRID